MCARCVGPRAKKTSEHASAMARASFIARVQLRGRSPAESNSSSHGDDDLTHRGCRWELNPISGELTRKRSRIQVQ